MGGRGLAEQALREAATALAEEKEGTEAALAWLALAKLLLEEGRVGARARVERIAAKLVSVFIREADRTQLLAVFLFTSACTRGKLTMGVVTEFARAIEGSRQARLTWWAEWGTVLQEEGGHDAAPLAGG